MYSGRKNKEALGNSLSIENKLVRYIETKAKDLGDEMKEKPNVSFFVEQKIESSLGGLEPPTFRLTV